MLLCMKRTHACTGCCGIAVHNRPDVVDREDVAWSPGIVRLDRHFARRPPAGAALLDREHGAVDARCQSPVAFFCSGSEQNLGCEPDSSTDLQPWSRELSPNSCLKLQNRRMCMCAPCLGAAPYTPHALHVGTRNQSRVCSHRGHARSCRPCPLCCLHNDSRTRGSVDSALSLQSVLCSRCCSTARRLQLGCRHSCRLGVVGVDHLGDRVVLADIRPLARAPPAKAAWILTPVTSA